MGVPMGSLWLWSVELAGFLPQLANVLVVSADVSDAVVVVQARTRSAGPAECAGCGQLSDWCHSRYVRRLADVTLAGRPVRIDLSVRRLYCENVTCPKVTFAEQIAGLTTRYQRRTPQLQGLVEDVGVVLAGRGGARMLRISAGCRPAAAARPRARRALPVRAVRRRRGSLLLAPADPPRDPAERRRRPGGDRFPLTAAEAHSTAPTRLPSSPCSRRRIRWPRPRLMPPPARRYVESRCPLRLLRGNFPMPAHCQAAGARSDWSLHLSDACWIGRAVCSGSVGDGDPPARARACDRGGRGWCSRRACGCRCGSFYVRDQGRKGRPAR